ncbi:MAG: exodeoxyribonuclease VII large subunit [Clostridia bacterium]|nr:exodeoxyribonuclease VII large subunit [Clostridia bacterium]
MEKSAISVTQLNQYLKTVLEADLNLRNIWVQGEISNLTIHGSGHIYLRLKDENGIVSAVMFRSNAAKLRFRPENGMKILAKGSVSVFEKTGAYQLYITEMKQDGEGDLYAALEQLKKQLAAAGIFDASHKKSIPSMPERIGVITSPTGAAVRDIIQITGRRYPLAEIVVYPAIVQGDQAPGSLINGIEYFEQFEKVDVIIIGRGGGSIEDLWGFNSPDLALAIYNCNTPVISAVGHETDFTICDFVADLRAPTPSGAAELVVPDQAELLRRIRQDQKHLLSALLRKMQHSRDLLERYAKARIMTDPHAFTDKPFMMLDHLTERLNRNILQQSREQRNTVATLIAKLDALSPLKVMQRGFSLVENENGKVVRSVEQLTLNEKIALRLPDGEATCTVKDIKKGNRYGKRNEV